MNPYLFIPITIAIYLLVLPLQKIRGLLAFSNPIVLTSALLMMFLHFTQTSYQTYMQAGRGIHFLLGVAIVALAFPLYQYRNLLKKNRWSLLCALTAGSITSVLSVYYLGSWLKLPTSIINAALAKSATTPVAVQISTIIGANTAITAAIVIITGLFGAIVFSCIHQRLHPNIVGFTVGVSAHGIGTAQAFRYSETAGVFAALGMCLNALLTTVLVFCVL